MLYYQAKLNRSHFTV